MSKQNDGSSYDRFSRADTVLEIRADDEYVWLARRGSFSGYMPERRDDRKMVRRHLEVLSHLLQALLLDDEATP